MPLFPRPDWPQHPDSDGLIAFWLDRHLSFRDITATLTTRTENRIA